MIFWNVQTCLESPMLKMHVTVLPLYSWERERERSCRTRRSNHIHSRIFFQIDLADQDYTGLGAIFSCIPPILKTWHMVEHVIINNSSESSTLKIWHCNCMLNLRMSATLTSGSCAGAFITFTYGPHIKRISVCWNSLPNVKEHMNFIEYYNRK